MMDTYSGDGLSARVYGRTVQVTVPAATSGGHLLAVICRLRHLRREVASENDWVVDVSALEDIPLSLLSVLMEMAEEIRSQGRHLAVIGLDAHCARKGPVAPTPGPFSA